MVGQLSPATLERVTGLGTQGQDLRRPRGWLGGRLQGRLLEHQVRIGPTEPEGADRRSTRSVRARPLARVRVDVEGTGREVDVWIRRAEVDARWDPLVVQRQRCLDDAGRARRDIEVADVGLEGPQ